MILTQYFLVLHHVFVGNFCVLCDLFASRGDKIESTERIV